MHKIEPARWLDSGPNWASLVSLYAKSVISGNTINKGGDIWAQTLREYLEAVNALFADRGYPQPTDFAIKSQPPTIFYENTKT